MSILEYFDAVVGGWFYYIEGDKHAERATRWRIDGAHEGTRDECEEFVRKLRPRWRSQ
jgi:hypothetical protein